VGWVSLLTIVYYAVPASLGGRRSVTVGQTKVGYNRHFVGIPQMIAAGLLSRSSRVKAYAYGDRIDD
jgi:hypothetical protein